MVRPREFTERLDVFPFEALIAGLAVVSGVVGLFDVGSRSDPLAALLPTWMTVGFEISYLASGFLMIVGLGVGRPRYEILGIALFQGSIVARFVALAWSVSVSDVVTTEDVIVALVFYVMMLAAARSRVRAIIRGHVVVKTVDKDGP